MAYAEGVLDKLAAGPNVKMNDVTKFFDVRARHAREV